jgi:hypothetical protein
MDTIPSISLRGIRTRAPRPDGAPRKLFHYLGNGEALFEIDNSSLESQTTCDRKAEYALVHSRIGESSYALTYGGAYHRCLEAYYRAKMDGVPFDLSKAIADAEAVFVAAPPPIGNWRTPEKLTASFERYIQRYALEDQWEILRCEQPFSVPLMTLSPVGVVPYPIELIFDNPDDVEDSTIVQTPNGLRASISVLHVSWTGVIDLNFRTEGELWIGDHKTTSIEGDQYWKAFDLSQQFLGYSWAIEKLHGQPVEGVLANVIYGREDAKTPAGVKTQREKEFSRRWLRYSPFHVKEWEVNITRIIQDFIHNLTSGQFPMKTYHCVNKFGICPYLDVCTQRSAENRMTMLYTSQYQNNVWNPLG